MNMKPESDSVTDASQDGMTICRIVKDEKIEIVPPPPPLAKAQNKEVWITPAKTKSEVLSKWANQQNNADNQDKPYNLGSIFNDSSLAAAPEDDLAVPDDEVTPDNLGLVCKICEAVEASDHELLTHYCSHFDNELKAELQRRFFEDFGGGPLILDP